jgi:hypothetical protein
MNGICVVSLKSLKIKNRLNKMHENYISDFIVFQNFLISCGQEDTEIKIWNTVTLTLENILSIKNCIFTKLAISNE